MKISLERELKLGEKLIKFAALALGTLKVTAISIPIFSKKITAIAILGTDFRYFSNEKLLFYI